MKTAHAALGLAAIAVIIGADAARATADGPDHYRVRGLAPGGTLTMRATPTIQAERVGTIPADARCLRNLGCRGGLSLDENTTLDEAEKARREKDNPRWCKIEHQGRTGWVEGRFLAESACPAAAADPDHRVERIRFAGGTSAAEVKTRLKGWGYVDYLIRAGAGQTVSVTLTATNPQTYFNVTSPGSDEAMFIGSIEGDRFERVVPADGDYALRVYLMRAAARRNEASAVTMQIGIGGATLAALPASQDARIPGTPFHAAATLPCTTGFPAMPRRCEAFVIRRGHDGTATVEARWNENGNERVRRILFVKGVPVASDATGEIGHERRDDRTVTRIGTDESFEIPDALIQGG